MEGELGPKYWNYTGNGTEDAKVTNTYAGSALNKAVVL